MGPTRSMWIVMSWVRLSWTLVMGWVGLDWIFFNSLTIVSLVEKTLQPNTTYAHPYLLVILIILGS